MGFVRTFFAVFSLHLGVLYASESGLEYLNTLRQSAGLTPLNFDDSLQRSATAHSRYMALHHTTGHREETGEEGFTGEYASERALAAGYHSIAVSENVSSGQQNLFSSIDKLFGGIYHRFTFLDMKKDLIGIGVEGDNYTYDLGNSLVDQLCQEHIYRSGPYYYHACADGEKRIEVSAYDQALGYYKHTESAPQLVVWPPKNGHDLLPGFYGENPDPLPDRDVSGYPISVEVNDAFYPEAPYDVVITLKDENGTELEGIMLDQNNDPAERFSAYQFAFFPLRHLEWGSRYDVTLRFDNQEKNWCFSTRSLASFGADKVYRIDGHEELRLNVLPGKSYALYIVPQGADDLFESYHYRYNTQKPSIAFIDRNTVLFSVEGDFGERVELTLDTPVARKITLVLAQEDSATLPREARCPEESSTAPTEEKLSYSYPSENPAEENLSAEEPREEQSLQLNDTPISGQSGGISVLFFLFWSVLLWRVVSRQDKEFDRS